VEGEDQKPFFARFFRAFSVFFHTSESFGDDIMVAYYRRIGERGMRILY
jgi:hypothetical protein